VVELKSVSQAAHFGFMGEGVVIRDYETISGISNTLDQPCLTNRPKKISRKDNSVRWKMPGLKEMHC